MKNKFYGKKRYLFVFIVLFITSCSERGPVSITKVEHFYISSNNAKNIFEIFTRQFGLPVVWDYQRWGGFSSGGITLGNVVLELIETPNVQSPTSYGIALEPESSLRSTMAFLDSAKIAHGRIGKAAEWSTLSLNNLLPEDINLFLCDYKDKDFVRSGRKKAADKLAEHNGGTLGIQFLKEIVIGTAEPRAFEKEWAKMPGVVKKGNEFHFSEGPNVKLIASDSFFLRLFIKVKSINNATLELETLGIKTSITEQGLELINDTWRANLTLIE